MCEAIELVRTSNTQRHTVLKYRPSQSNPVKNSK